MARKNYSKLVKKVITDKRGRKTTVWVRSDKHEQGKVATRYKKMAEKRDQEYEARKRKRKKGVSINLVVKEEEKRILDLTNNQFEACSVITKSGEVVLRKRGNEDSISFDEHEAKAMQGAEVFTHNHPLDNSLSQPDIVTTLLLEVNKMRAVTPNSPEGKGAWVFERGDLNKKDLRAFKLRYNKIYRETTEYFQEKIDAKRAKWEKSGAMMDYIRFQEEIEFANMNHYKEIWTRLFVTGKHSDEYKKRGVKFYYEKAR